MAGAGARVKYLLTDIKVLTNKISLDFCKQFSEICGPFVLLSFYLLFGRATATVTAKEEAGGGRGDADRMNDSWPQSAQLPVRAVIMTLLFGNILYAEMSYVKKHIQTHNFIY